MTIDRATLALRERMARALGWTVQTLRLSSDHFDHVWLLPNGDVYGDTLPPFENARLSGDSFDQWRDRCKLVADKEVASWPFQISAKGARGSKW